MATKAKSRAKEDGKARLELRFEAQLAERVKKLAEDAGVSVNQLLQGLAQWAVENAVRGGADARRARKSACAETSGMRLLRSRGGGVTRATR